MNLQFKNLNLITIIHIYTGETYIYINFKKSRKATDPERTINH